MLLQESVCVWVHARTCVGMCEEREVEGKKVN